MRVAWLNVVRPVPGACLCLPLSLFYENCDHHGAG